MYHLLIPLIILYGCIFNVYASNTGPCTDHYCVSVVNAGSSGTRFFIYSFDLDKTETPIHIKKVWGVSINPGISTIDHQPQSVFSYLDKLFEKSPIHQLPVYFYATGGMRLLSAKNNNATYALIKQWFNKHKEWTLMEARTITGEEEGLFAWLENKMVSLLLL